MISWAFFKYFGWFKVPLIGYLRPKIIELNDNECIIRIKLSRRSKNHLNSLYFGAFCIGADICGGLHAFHYAKQKKLKISFAFKSFEAQFLKRAHSDVYFKFKEGRAVLELLQSARHTKLRQNMPLTINCFCDNELVAKFKLELSIKVIA